MVQRESQLLLNGINGSERVTNMEDNERNGNPVPYRTSDNVEQVQNLVHSDRHLSIRALAGQLSLDKDRDKF